METDANQDLHGNVPDSAHAALLLIDVLNDFDFPQNEHLQRRHPARLRCGLTNPYPTRATVAPTGGF